MSSLGDAFTALKNIVLLQERIEVIQRDLVKINADVADLSSYARDIDKRVFRIENMIEFASGGGAPRLGQ